MILTTQLLKGIFFRGNNVDITTVISILGKDKDALREVLLNHFRKPENTSLLLQTEVENITHVGDSYWGVIKEYSPNLGENHLGRILMEIRSELRSALKEEV